jgi:flagellar biosynthetic protein FliR
MNGSGLETVLPQLAGANLVGFVLVLARVAPLFLLAPVFSARFIPGRAKAMAAFAIALAIAPVASRGIAPPEDVFAAAQLILKEVVVGLAFAFVISTLGAAVQAGAGLVDNLIGFSFAALVDPITNMHNAIVGQVYALFVALVFVVTGGDQIMIGGLARTYDVVPIDGYPSAAALGQLGLTAITDIFVIGLALVAPVLIALLVTDAAFAIVARVAPQVNVFAVGLPAKILLGFGAIAASLPFVANHVQDDLQNAVWTALRGLGGG